VQVHAVLFSRVSRSVIGYITALAIVDVPNTVKLKNIEWRNSEIVGDIV
jgi:hypothetical protein